MCGRLSWPTALMTASTTTVSSPSGPRSSTVQRCVVVRPGGRDCTSVRKRMSSAQAEGVGAVAEVAVQHRLGGVVERPVVALGERVAEVVVGVVDPAPRIAVLVPGAADVVVLVDDDEVDARLGEAVAGEQARHAGPDDQHAEVGVGGDLVLAPGGAAPVLAAVGQLLLQQRQVGGDVEAAHGVAHDAEDVGVGRRGRGDAAAVTEGDQRVERQGADRRRLLVGEPAGREREQQWIGLQVVAEQRHVARGVGQRGEQRLQLGVGQEAADLVVGAVDRGDLGDERTRRRRGRVGHGLTVASSTGPWPVTRGVGRAAADRRRTRRPPTFVFGAGGHGRPHSTGHVLPVGAESADGVTIVSSAARRPACAHLAATAPST